MKYFVVTSLLLTLATLGTSNENTYKRGLYSSSYRANSQEIPSVGGHSGQHVGFTTSHVVAHGIGSHLVHNGPIDHFSGHNTEQNLGRNVEHSLSYTVMRPSHGTEHIQGQSTNTIGHKTGSGPSTGYKTFSSGHDSGQTLGHSPGLKRGPSLVGFSSGHTSEQTSEHFIEHRTGPSSASYSSGHNIDQAPNHVKKPLGYSPGINIGQAPEHLTELRSRPNTGIYNSGHNIGPTSGHFPEPSTVSYKPRHNIDQTPGHLTDLRTGPSTINSRHNGKFSDHLFEPNLRYNPGHNIGQVTSHFSRFKAETRPGAYSSGHSVDKTATSSINYNSIHKTGDNPRHLVGTKAEPSSVVYSSGHNMVHTSTGYNPKPSAYNSEHSMGLNPKPSSMAYTSEHNIVVKPKSVPHGYGPKTATSSVNYNSVHKISHPSQQPQLKAEPSPPVYNSGHNIEYFPSHFTGPQSEPSYKIGQPNDPSIDHSSRNTFDHLAGPSSVIYSSNQDIGNTSNHFSEIKIDSSLLGYNSGHSQTSGHLTEHKVEPSSVSYTTGQNIQTSGHISGPKTGPSTYSTQNFGLNKEPWVGLGSIGTRYNSYNNDEGKSNTLSQIQLTGKGHIESQSSGRTIPTTHPIKESLHYNQDPNVAPTLEYYVAQNIRHGKNLPKKTSHYDTHAASSIDNYVGKGTGLGQNLGVPAGHSMVSYQTNVSHKPGSGPSMHGSGTSLVNTGGNSETILEEHASTNTAGIYGGSVSEGMGTITVTTRNQTISVPYSVPYTVTVNRPYPVPVPRAVPFDIPRPVPMPKSYPEVVNNPVPAHTVPVPQHYPVPVSQHYPARKTTSLSPPTYGGRAGSEVGEGSSQTGKGSTAEGQRHYAQRSHGGTAISYSSVTTNGHGYVN